MFNRDELLIMARDIKDEKLLEKVNSMLYVDEELASILKERYIPLNLIKIEKSNDKNEYFLHFLNSEEDNDFNLIWDTIQLSSKYLEDKGKDRYLDLEIHTTEHESLDDFWCYGGIDVYTREDLANYIKNKKYFKIK